MAGLDFEKDYKHIKTEINSERGSHGIESITDNESKLRNIRQQLNQENSTLRLVARMKPNATEPKDRFNVSLTNLSLK